MIVARPSNHRDVFVERQAPIENNTLDMQTRQTGARSIPLNNLPLFTPRAWQIIVAVHVSVLPGCDNGMLLRFPAV